MDYRQVRLELQKGLLRTLYVFSGSEDFLKEELLGEMLKVMRSKGLEPDLLKVDGKKLDWRDLRREAEQVTIFSRGRVILVKDAPYFSNMSEKNNIVGEKGSQKSKGQSKKEPLQEELAAFLLGRSVDSLLVFFIQNVDKRRKINKYLEKSGNLVEFPPLKGAALYNWIRDELVRESKKIDDDALAILVQRCGENLLLIKSELEKLVISLGKEKKIDSSLIEKLVPENVPGNIFSLVDDLGRKNAAGALKHLHRMRQQNEPMLRILSMIIRHFRLLYRANILRQEGFSTAKISATLQVHPFVTGKLVEQLPSFSGDAFPRIIHALKEVDLAIKTGRVSGEEALEQLILKLAFSESENA